MRPPGAKAIVSHKDRVLLVLRDDRPDIPEPNKWNTPGGGIEAGESPREALIREFQEEINLQPSCVIELGTTTYSDGSVVHRFFCPITDEEFARIRLVGEGQRLQWFTWDEVLERIAAGGVSDYLSVYVRHAEQEIRALLEGKRIFSVVEARLEL